MAVTTSGLFVLTFRDSLNSTQLALDLTSGLKLSLHNNSITPNFDSDTSYAVSPYDATNEVSGTGWSAGGVSLASPTLTATGSGVLTLDANDVAQSGVTISGARCALIYSNSLSPKRAIALINFGADYGASGGNFTLAFSAQGIAALKLA